MQESSLEDPEAYDYQARGQKTHLRVPIGEEPSDKAELLAWRFYLEVQASMDGKLGCLWLEKEEDGKSFRIHAPLPQDIKESYSHKEDLLKGLQIQTAILEHAWRRLRELGLPVEKVVRREIGIPKIGEEKFPCRKP